LHVLPADVPMNRESQTTVRASSIDDEVALIRHGDDAALSDEVLLHAGRERGVATLRLIWERRQFLFRLFVYAAVCSFLVALLIPSRYESTTQLMPPDQQSGSGLLASLASGKSGDDFLGGVGGLGALAGGILGTRTSSDLFVGVLQSRTVQDDLISKFNLRRVYWDRSWEEARKDLTEKTEVTIDRKSGILTIKVTDRSPARAAAMAGEYVDQLNQVMSRLNTSAAHRESAFLAGRLQQVKQDLEIAEKNFGEFSSKNSTLNITDQGKAMVEAGGALEGQLIASETELQGLKQIYSDNNVRVRSLQARTEELRRQIQKMGGKAGTASDAETPDTNSADSIYPTLRKLPLLAINYADLLRQTRIQEAIFSTLTQEYELSRVEEAKELPSVKVLDPANVPERKSFPPRFLITLVGGLLGVAMGVVWMFGTLKWNQVDERDPAKLFVQEVVRDVRGRLHIFSRNGSVSGAPTDLQTRVETEKAPGAPGPRGPS